MWNDLDADWNIRWLAIRSIESSSANLFGRDAWGDNLLDPASLYLAVSNTVIEQTNVEAEFFGTNMIRRILEESLKSSIPERIQ
jgi:hypothetical protein